MALFDILKSKKEEPKKTAKKPAKKAKQDLDEILNKSPEAAKNSEIAKPKHFDKKTFTEAYRFLISAHVTEKSGLLADKGSYVFLVTKDSNKYEIKKAVQELYGVKVESVRMINLPGKERRLGRSVGFKPGNRKAIVKLVAGEKIDLMPR